MIRFAFLLTLLIAAGNSLAQHDSSYIESYDGYVVGRFLVNRKYTRVTIANDAQDYLIRYVPNKTFSAGLGASYRFATINLTIGVLRPDESKGKTRDFDLQINKYGRRFVTDLFFQFYNGFYLTDRDFAPPDAEYYVRPDISVNAIGGSSQYIFNHRKFSYRAVFQQTEAQKRSAGSFLLGMELYVGRFKGDSTIVPSRINRERPSERINKMRFVDFGPNAGYAYTWVINRFFLTASASASLNLTINQFYQETGRSNSIGISPNTFLRGSIGYNSDRWSINFLAIAAGFHFPRVEERTVNVNSGRYRMNFIYRFKPNRKTRKALRFIDKLDEKI